MERKCPYPHLNHLAGHQIDVAPTVRELYQLLDREEGIALEQVQGYFCEPTMYRAFASALSAHMITSLWEEMKAKLWRYEPLVDPSKVYFWSNFMIHLINLTQEMQEDWVGEMQKRQQSESEFKKKDQLYKLYKFLGDFSPGSVQSPEFDTYILMFGKFMQAIEAKYKEEVGTPMPDEAFEQAIENPQIFRDMNALLFNPRFGFAPLIYQMCAPEGAPAEQAHFKNPRMPFRTVFFSSDMATRTFRLEPVFVTSYRSTLAEEPGRDLQYNCPLIYNHLFREIWDWFVALAKFYRLKKPLPDEIKCTM